MMKTKSKHYIQELCLFVDAGGEELVSMVDELWLAHDGVFLHQAQCAAIEEGSKSG